MIKKLFLIINIITLLYMQQGSANNNSNINLPFKSLEVAKNKKIYYSYDNLSPVISIDIAFKNAGYAIDSKDKLGLSYLFLYFLKQNEVGNNAQKLKEAIEKNAIKIDFSVDEENMYFSIKIVKSKLAFLEDIIKKIFTAKFYNEKIFLQNKHNLLETYKNNLGKAGFLSNIKLQEKLFKNSDLAKNPYGTEKTHANISLDDLNDLPYNRFTQNNIIFAISGNITENRTIKFYNNITKDLKHGFALNYREYRDTYKSSSNQYPLAKEQVLIKAYFPTIAKNHREFYKYYLANYIIGGAGLNSILTKEIREKHGLTYSIYSGFDVYNDFSLWVCEFSTDKAKYKDALNKLKKIFKDIHNKGISEEELIMAKQYLIGSFDIYFNSNEKISSYLLDAALRGVPTSYIRNRNEVIESYSLKEVNDVIKKFIIEDKISYIIIGDI
jgi:zinc protease